MPAANRTASPVRTPRAAPLALAGVLACHALIGCNIAAPALFIIEGPPKVEARYKELDPGRTTAIFIDDRKSKVPKRSLRMTMGQVAEREMMDRGIVLPANMISTRDTARVAAAKDTFNEPISVVDLGREIGAEVVIWVEIDDWTLSRDGGSLSPAVGARVKIVDAKNNTRIWPGDIEGYPLAAQVPTRPQELSTTRSDLDRYHEELARYAGRELARLFYTYERDTLESRRTN